MQIHYYVAYVMEEQDSNDMEEVTHKLELESAMDIKAEDGISFAKNLKNFILIQTPSRATTVAKELSKKYTSQELAKMSMNEYYLQSQTEKIFQLLEYEKEEQQEQKTSWG